MQMLNELDCNSRDVDHEPSMKSVPSEGTSENLLFIEGIHVDVTKMHDGLSKLIA